MKQDQELEKCQKIMDKSIKEYIYLLNKKSLLKESLKKNYNNSNNLIHSIRIIQETLYSSLLIDVHAWLFDESRNRKNLSLYKLLEKLKNENQKFLNILKEYYITPPSVVNLSNEINIDFWEKEHKRKKAKEFDEKIILCINTYNSFINSEIGINIKNIRDKVLAHKENGYIIENKGHYIGEAIEAMEKMNIIIRLLNEIFQKKYYPIDEEEKNSSKKAKVFWEYIYNNPSSKKENGFEETVSKTISS
ncbi:hypothetical protein [Halarcobacter ebronensis]|uniref:HEPN AbiU2-like domain-containing protein n=1 Tax=Halarcobacter ebronensis TaxID=1462615 RepID=A0A4Q1ALU5_9BACT|nr:hypothetical protein [Halarcobacter ebronensis]QKF81920.1 hypothetical protein AEBR_1433 [Halarcobacter ebronensis]RXK04361.1 hypothetical protein CRV07_11370 [Halarcobacter ebronensis]